MVDVDLLDGFTFGPSTVPDAGRNDYFTQHFWGEKNQGFDVLYHNMKHGQTSVKSLQEFIRESATSEDLYAKHLTKLAKQAANSSTLGSFAPMFDVFKVMAEKLSSCHMDVVHKLQDIIKDLSKYLEEQKSKHKQVKDELSGTADALHQIQVVSSSVQKSKEKFHQLCLEAERLRRTNLLKDAEKAEVKSKKASEEYKHFVEKYKNVRSDFEQKMTDSAKRFQEIEVAHLKHMKSVLDSYILSYENANVLVGQVHQEFRRQVGENTIDTLIKQYSESKGTGTEKPEPIVFEECDVNSVLVTIDPARTNGVANEEPQNKSRKPINLPFRRKKPRKSPRENAAGNKETDKETESMGSPDKDAAVKLDEEGYTIRPETPKETKSNWSFASNDSSDSDSDDYISRKIHVKINPKDKVPNESGENNLDALNAITRNLTLNSPTPTGGKKLTRRRSGTSRNSPSICNESQTDSHSPVSPAHLHAALSCSSKAEETIPTSPKSPKSTSLSGAVKVLPSPTSSNVFSEPVTPPVPAPRRISLRSDINKLSVRRKDARERFSTDFVSYSEFTKVFEGIRVSDSHLQEFNNISYEANEGTGSSSDDNFVRKPTQNASSTSASHGESNLIFKTLPSPLRIPPRLTRISEKDAYTTSSRSSEQNASENVASNLVSPPRQPQPRGRRKSMF